MVTKMITYEDIKKTAEEFDVDIALERRGENFFLKVENGKKPKPPVDLGISSVF